MPTIIEVAACGDRICILSALNARPSDHIKARMYGGEVRRSVIVLLLNPSS